MKYIDIVFLFFVKTSLFTNYKFMYELAPFFAKDFGISLPQFATTLALPEVAIFLCAFISPFLDKIPAYKLGFWMYLECAIVTALVALLRLLPTEAIYILLLVLRFLFGFGYALVTSSITTIIGDNTSDHMRGRAMSFVESGWMASDFLFPLLGYLVQWYPDEVLWVGQGIIALFFAIVFYWRMPTKIRRASSTESVSLLGHDNHRKNQMVKYLKLIKKLAKSARFVALMIFAFFQCLGSTLLPIVFGVWLKDDYDFDSKQVGNAVLSLSIGELIGFVTSFLMIDLFGCLPTLYFATTFEFGIALVFFLGRNFGFKAQVVLIVLQVAGTELAFLSCITWSSKISKYTFVVVTCLLAIFAVGRGVIVVLSPILWIFVKENISWPTMGVIMMLIGLLMLMGTTSILIGEFVHRRSINRHNLLSPESSL